MRTSILAVALMLAAGSAGAQTYATAEGARAEGARLIRIGADTYGGSGADAVACYNFYFCKPYGPFPSQEHWVVGDIAADNGLTVAVEVGSVVDANWSLAKVRSTSIAMLDGIIFTDFRHRQDVRVRIEHNCDTGRSTILDYPVINYRGGQSVLSPEKAAIWRKSAMAWQYPERLSPVAEATVQVALCNGTQIERQEYSSPAEAERWVLRTDHANNPEVALSRAHRIILENRQVISDALQKMTAGECKAQKSRLIGALEKRDNYLLKLAYAAEGREGAGLHAGESIVYGNDDAMDFELSAVQAARACVGDTSPLPAQGVKIPKALMPVQDKE